jgi:hypothetical protein
MRQPSQGRHAPDRSSATYTGQLIRSLHNQCGRLVALVIIAYNSILLSAVLDRHQAAGDEAAIARLQKVSPVAWQSILFLGRYLFHGPRHPIDLDDLIAAASLS